MKGQHSLMAANKDLLDAYYYMPSNTEKEHTARGAVLHTFDSLQELAEELGIEGFIHPDDMIE